MYVVLTVLVNKHSAGCRSRHDDNPDTSVPDRDNRDNRKADNSKADSKCKQAYVCKQVQNNNRMRNENRAHNTNHHKDQNIYIGDGSMAARGHNDKLSPLPILHIFLHPRHHFHILLLSTLAHQPPLQSAYSNWLD
jgi:hypothetical protein